MQINQFTNGKTNTPSVMKVSVSLVVAAMLLTAAFAVPAAAQKQVPFKGSLQGHETDTPEGGPLRRWDVDISRIAHSGHPCRVMVRTAVAFQLSFCLHA
jgi:hypothetical protein